MVVLVNGADFAADVELRGEAEVESDAEPSCAVNAFAEGGARKRNQCLELRGQMSGAEHGRDCEIHVASSFATMEQV